MVYSPVGSDVLLTAMSRWVGPRKSPVGGSISNVCTTTNQGCVAWSKRQLASRRLGPKSNRDGVKVCCQISSRWLHACRRVPGKTEDLTGRPARSKLLAHA